MADAAQIPRRGFTPPAEFDEYRLVRLIGEGAWGQVFLGHDTLLDRPVAIKFISAIEPDAFARERFLLEARAIARLLHPNVVTIFRVSEVCGRPYLVSEYIRGKSLDRIERPLPWREALGIAIGIARGLGAAHLRGVLHRDIKPANVILAEDGEVKLLDFGLAKLMDAGGSAPLEDPAPSEPAPLSASLALEDTASFRPVRSSPAARASGSGPAPSTPKTLTGQGALVGTPRYMSPEAWRGEPLGPPADVYSLGVLLYELLAGRAPHAGADLATLRQTVTSEDAEPLGSAAPAVESGLAEVVDRCLKRDPGARFRDGAELCHALERLRSTSPSKIPPGNPYRGLHAFEAEHRALFFGRSLEIRAITELLRSEPLVVVAGDSGVGKSSICRAGVLPLVEETGLSEGRAYRAATMTPSYHPLATLLDVVLGEEARGDVSLSSLVHADPAALARHLRRRLGRTSGLLLFVDQLEELVTHASPGEAALFSEALAHLGGRLAGVRLLLTARGDFLTRLAALPGLGGMLGRAIYLLRPLSSADLREAVEGPAREKGVRFETEALVDSLVGSTAAAQGGLPLLQFALAELWEERDQVGRVIPEAALQRIGGVSGALARHADDVLLRLLPAQRAAARRILLMLVGPDSTRLRRGQADLLRGDEADALALEALTSGRLLVAREDGHYEVAHEALISGWSTLRGWLSADAEDRELRARIAVAATEWQRLSRSREALWHGMKLREVASVDEASGELSSLEAEFLRESRRHDRRTRLRRRALLALAPLSLALLWGGATLRIEHQRSRVVSACLDRAAASLAQAAVVLGRFEAGRAAAFARFDRGDTEGGERLWSGVVKDAERVRALYAEAMRQLEAALLTDSKRRDVRERFAETIYLEAMFAERNYRGEERDELIRRLEQYDRDGHWRARLTERARLQVIVRPEGARIVAYVYRRHEGRRDAEQVYEGAGGALELPPGSYLFALSARGRVAMRYPLLLRPGEERVLDLELPPEADVPPGFVLVPAGRFLFGSADHEGFRRTALLAQPMHEVETGAYLIGKHEVTFAEWIAYLEALPDEERAQRSPRARSYTGSIRLTRTAPGRYVLSLRPTTMTFTVAMGEKVRYPARQRLAEQDWLRFPVTGISWDDSLGYLAWLDRSGRVPGARLCTEHEWERAARGADDRVYPSGDTLDPADANFDETYGRQPLAYGPDEVGSHPRSDSPFGVADLAGNAWEWTRSVDPAQPIVYRGGGWYETQRSSLSVNRQPGEATLRDVVNGLRVCASYPHQALHPVLH